MQARCSCGFQADCNSETGSKLPLLIGKNVVECLSGGLKCETDFLPPPSAQGRLPEAHLARRAFIPENPMAPGWGGKSDNPDEKLDTFEEHILAAYEKGELKSTSPPTLHTR